MTVNRRDFTWFLTAGLAGLGVGSAVASAAEPNAMRRYVRRIRGDLERLRREQLAALSQAGEVLAERVASGGRLLIYDRRGPYSAEATGRAGGLMAIHRVRPGQEETITSKEALLIVADRPADEADLAMAKAARERGAAVVGICPARERADSLSSLCDVAIDNHVTDQDAAIEITGVAGPIAPTSGVLNTAVLWAVTAAYIEAMERRGKPPHIWMSIKRPDAKEFNAAAQEATKEAGY
jgi:uncharacterized phosphosugar-binding protein